MTLPARAVLVAPPTPAVLLAGEAGVGRTEAAKYRDDQELVRERGLAWLAHG